MFVLIRCGALIILHCLVLISNSVILWTTVRIKTFLYITGPVLKFLSHDDLVYGRNGSALYRPEVVGSYPDRGDDDFLLSFLN